MGTTHLTPDDLDVTHDSLPDGFDTLGAIGLSTAARMLRGRRGRAASVEAVRRWVLRGCPVGGELVRLRAVRLSGEWLTTEGWVRDFERDRVRLGRQQPLAGEPPPRARLADQRRADAVLDRAGVGGKGAPREEGAKR